MSSEKSIFLYTHASNLEAVILLLILPTRLSFVAKDSLFKIPVLGAILRWGKCIPIARENLADAKHSLAIAENRLMEGRHIVLAPEGTRRRSKSNPNKGGDNIAEFKKGPFHVAKNVPARIVPIVFSGSHRILGPSESTIKAGTIYVDYIQPISKHAVEAFPSHEELRLHVQQKTRSHAKSRSDAKVLGKRGDNLPWVVGYTFFLLGLLYVTLLRR